jgi:capsular exopolysaccharide synthesis family protein
MSKNFELMNQSARDPMGGPLSRPLNYAPHLPSLSPSPQQVVGGTDETFAAVLWRTVQNHRWAIAVFTVFVMAIVATASFLMKPKYEAVARIVVVFHGDKNGNMLGFKDVDNSLLEDPEDRAAIDTQIAILKTDELALRVIKDLHLDTNPKFTGSPQQSGNFEGLVRLFHSALSISKVKGTRLIEIGFLSTDPHLAADVVNTLANDYEDQYYRGQVQMSSQVTQFLTDQLKELQVKVESSQKRLVDYERANSLFGLDDKQNIVTEKLDDLNKGLTAAEADRAQKEVNYRLARSGQPELIENLEPDNLLNKLRTQQADLQSQIAQAAVQLGPANPKMAELSKELAQVQSSIKTEVSRIGQHITYEYQGAMNREQALRGALEEQKRAANQVNVNAVQADILKHDFEANRALYDDLLQKQKELAIASSLRSNNIWVVDPARAPILPSQPKILLNLALSLVLGLFGGILLAFGLEKLSEKTINGMEQAQILSSLPALGAVPLLNPKSKSRKPLQIGNGNGNGHGNPALVCLLQPLSLTAESYKSVLTSLLLSQPTPPAVIQVTSALPQEGKTTISTNLAILLARLRRRVLLVDADLRRPRIHVALRLNATSGLGALLRNSDPLEEKVIACANVPNLFVLPAGSVSLPEDTELLVSNFKDLVEGWRRQFDHVIIDTPPVLPVADALRMSVEADSVILVMRAGQTARDAFLRAQDSLLRVKAPLAGFVLNGVQLDSSAFRYYTSYHGEDQPKRLATGAEARSSV